MENTISPQSSERARQSWRTLGYGGLAVPLLLNLDASDAVVAVTAAAFALPSVLHVVASHRERNGDVLPPTITHKAGDRERRELEPHTFSGMLDKWRAELPFEDFVTEAANSSNEYNRRLTVIYLQIPGLPSDRCESGAELLRMKVRSTDAVTRISSDEFLVCAPFLRDALAADVIANRLADAVLKAGLADSAAQMRLGKAIYPMHGYCGVDLIGHARTASRALA